MTFPEKLHAVFVDSDEGPGYACLAPQPEDSTDAIAFSGNFYGSIPDDAERLWEELARRWSAHADLLAACEAMHRELRLCADQLATLGYHSKAGGSVHSAIAAGGNAIAKAKGAA